MSETEQRAADGGIAARGDEGMDFGGETEGDASLSRAAYDCMRREGAISASSRVAPQENSHSCPCRKVGAGVFLLL